jgi:hypothetical protein
LGGLALALLAGATLAGLNDVHAGKVPLGAGGMALSVLACLGWVLADAPVNYEVGAGTLTVVTRLRRLRYAVRFAARQQAPWRDRFAINGGFGWYGWFRCEGRSMRAFVTDPAFRVLLETEAGPVVVSPFSPDGAISRIRGDGD